MTRTARRSWSAGTAALLAAALLLVVWATLAPRSGALAEGDALRFCLWCGDARLTDAIANVALFLPLGFALVLAGRPPRQSFALCLLLTLGIEATQYALPSGRIASLSDALTNATGGAIGAGLAWTWRAWMWPRAAQAARLAGAWALLVVLLFVATAWAVSAPTPSSGDVAAARTSPLLSVTPGFGWYHGTIIGTLVDGVELPHRGTGPALVEAPLTSRRVARVALTGRDERSGAVPFLYLHAPHDPRAVLLLAQRGSAVVLRAASRASRAGLAPLETSVAGAFSADSMRPGDTTLVTARVSTRELSLTVERGARRWSAATQRTPTLGWSLVQSLVPVSARVAGALTAIWLLLLAFPIGYWGWWAGSVRAYIILGASTTVALAIALTVARFAIAHPPRWQWCALAGGIALGMLVGMLLGRGTNGSGARDESAG